MQDQQVLEDTRVHIKQHILLHLNMVARQIEN